MERWKFWALLLGSRFAPKAALLLCQFARRTLSKNNLLISGLKKSGRRTSSRKMERRTSRSSTRIQRKNVTTMASERSSDRLSCTHMNPIDYSFWLFHLDPPLFLTNLILIPPPILSWTPSIPHFQLFHLNLPRFRSFGLDYFPYSIALPDWYW